MTRLLASGLATLVVLLAFSWWLRPGVEARDGAAAGPAPDPSVTPGPPPPTPVSAPPRTARAAPPSPPAPAPEAPRASRPAPTPDPAPEPALQEAEIPDRRALPFLEGDTRGPAAVVRAGPPYGAAPPDAEPTGATEPAARASLIRRLLTVYERLGVEPR